MSNTKHDGRATLGLLLTVVGAVGAACGALLLYVLDFHLILQGWIDELRAVTVLPETYVLLTKAKLFAMGLFLAGGGAVVLATGLGTLLGLRLMLRTGRDATAPERPARGASLTGTST